MIILGIWFIGAVVTLLAFKWLKEFTFRLNYDSDGMKILTALAWPIFLIAELADLVSTWTDHFVDTFNKKEDNTLRKVVDFFGKTYRKYL